MGAESSSNVAWREALLQRLLIVSLPLVTLGVTFGTFWSIATNRLWMASLWPFVAALAFVTWRRELPYTVRAAPLVAAFTYATVFSYILGGFHGNQSVLGAMSVVLVGLFFGRKAMLVLLGLLLLAPICVALAMVRGALPLPDPAMTGAGVPRAWARTTAIVAILWTTLGLAVTFVVERIESALRTEHSALLELRAEQAKREQAEEQRREAERVVTQAQKLELAGQLAAGIAHDFNNVLSVVQCWAELALRQNPTEQNRIDGHEGILAATRQGTALAQQLLAFCRRNVRTVQQLDLARAVDGVMKVLRRALPDDIELSIEHGTHTVVRADEIELHQIILNFVVNARDAMQGGGRLRVVTGSGAFDADIPVVGGSLRAGRWATLTVEDTGPGIDPKLQVKIFEPFFTTKPVGVGTGLGLATVLGIAKESGGGVSLDSKPGSGARFTVYLPEESGVEVRASSTMQVGDVRAPARAARILLVEDSAPIRRLMQAILEKAGHTVVAVADGHRAVEAIDENGFDLLCTDAVMPGEPVRQVVDAFEEKHPQGRVLIASGHVDEELTRRGLEQGRYRLLRKPFLPPELCAAVDELLERARAA